VFCLILTLLNISVGVIQYLITPGSELMNLVMSCYSILAIIVWAVLKMRFRKLTVLIPCLYMVVHAIDINLIFRDKLRPKLQIEDKNVLRNQLIYYFLIANVGNFMDIKLTTFLFVPIFICAQVLQLKQEAVIENLRDPSKSANMFRNETSAVALNNMVLLALLVVVQQYLN